MHLLLQLPCKQLDLLLLRHCHSWAVALAEAMWTATVPGSSCHADVLQEDVHIQHVRADERKQQADVHDKIISQVDELVEYFNGLYDDDQMDIRWADLTSWVQGEFTVVQRTIAMKSNECSKQNRAEQQQGLWLLPHTSQQRAWPTLLHPAVLPKHGHVLTRGQ